MVSYGPFFSRLNIFVHGHLNGASNIDLHWLFKHHCVGMHEWMEQRLVAIVNWLPVPTYIV